MMQKRSDKKLALLAIITLLFFSLSSGNSFAARKEKRRASPRVAKQASRILELRSIDQLKEAFQRDAGKVRLVTILSPA